MRRIGLYICICITMCLCSCSVNKFIPENHYLLDEVNIESDNKDVKPDLFNSYLRQIPNAKWFNLVKVPMRIYCISGQDSTKWINRFFRGIGDAPEIYDEQTAVKTQTEIEKAVRNMGYMRGSVRMTTEIKKKRLKLNYFIESGRPYTVRHIAYDINDLQINEIIENDSAQSLLHEGMVFDVSTLDNERQRITRLLQNNGYYKFNKDFLVYQADTVRNTFVIDLTMKLLPFQQRKEDVPTKHQQFKIRDVNFLTSENVSSSNNVEEHDSIHYRGLNIYFKGKTPDLRPKVLSTFNYIRPQSLYNEQDVQNTYTSMGRLRTLKYTNIRFTEVEHNDSTMLDANIHLTKTKPQSFSFEIEGTNSAGDLGAAASLTYQHRNLFKGSESFTIKFRGAYESITGLEDGYDSDNYKEWGVESSLNFPEFKFPFLSSEFKRKIRATSEVGLKFNSQLRPEFTRTLASASWSYRWTDRSRSQHRFDLLDINYI